MTITSSKYIRALGAVDMPVEVMEEALEIYESEPALAEALGSPVIHKENKYAVVDRIFPEQVRSLMKVLCEYSDMEFFPEIVEGYKAYVNEHHQILDAELRYVTPPDESQTEEIKQFLCRKYEAKDVNLQMEEDPDLIGGFVLSARGSEYDWSLKGRLAGLRNKLTGGETDGRN